MEGEKERGHERRHKAGSQIRHNVGTSTQRSAWKMGVWVGLFLISSADHHCFCCSCRDCDSWGGVWHVKTHLPSKCSLSPVIKLM